MFAIERPDGITPMTIRVDARASSLDKEGFAHGLLVARTEENATLGAEVQKLCEQEILPEIGQVVVRSGPGQNSG